MKAILVKMLIVIAFVYGIYLLVGSSLLAVNPQILRNLEVLAQMLK